MTKKQVKHQLNQELLSEKAVFPWGVDTEKLCQMGYNYRGTDDMRFLCITEDRFGKRLPGAFHFTGAKETFLPPSGTEKKGRIHVNPDLFGTDLYYNPQTFKRSWVSPQKFSHLSEEKKKNYRTTKRKMGGSCGFASKDILSYKDIVIDIDNHEDPSEWVQKSVKKVTDVIENGVLESTGETIITPSFVVLTGRGVQIHYEMEPVYFPAEKKVRQAAEALVRFWNGILSGIDFSIKETTIPLSVDHDASLNIGGYKRLPGSRNWSAMDPETHEFGYRVTKTLETGKTYPINDLLTELHEPIYKKKKNANKSTPATTAKKARHAGGKRTESWDRAFHDIVKTVQKGSRNNFLFASGCVMCDGKRDVSSFVNEMNSLLSEPLQKKEIAHIIVEASSGKYHFSNASLMTRFHLSEEYLAQFGLSKDGCFVKNADRDKMRAEKKQERDNRILSLIRSGASINACAKKLRHSRVTIRKVIARAKEICILLAKRNAENKRNFMRLLDRFKRVVDWFCDVFADVFTKPVLAVSYPLTS